MIFGVARRISQPVRLRQAAPWLGLPVLGARAIAAALVVMPASVGVGVFLLGAGRIDPNAAAWLAGLACYAASMLLGYKPARVRPGRTRAVHHSRCRIAEIAACSEPPNHRSQISSVGHVSTSTTNLNSGCSAC